MKRVMVVSTTDRLELAQEIASALVEAREAACVNIIPRIQSIYRWEEKVCREEEHLLFIKTSAERFDAVKATIRRLHSYDVPEVIALEITEGDPDYLKWLDASIASRHGG